MLNIVPCRIPSLWSQYTIPSVAIAEMAFRMNSGPQAVGSPCKQHINWGNSPQFQHPNFPPSPPHWISPPFSPWSTTGRSTPKYFPPSLSHPRQLDFDYDPTFTVAAWNGFVTAVVESQREIYAGLRYRAFKTVHVWKLALFKSLEAQVFMRASTYAYNKPQVASIAHTGGKIQGTWFPGPSNQRRIVKHLHQDRSPSPFKFPSFNVNIFKHSFNFPLDFGRSGISAQCGNIEYTTYRRPASGLECSKTSETPLEANAPLHFQRAVCNLPLPDALAFNCRGAAAACDDSLPRSSLASEFAPRRNNSRPVLPARGVARRDFILRSLAPRVPARRAIKSAFADSAFVDLTQAVNQHNRDALDFLAESTVLLRVHALPALCAIRVSHTPTLPPCKPACAPVCRQD
ncbi:hypothetical protein C8R43DRAFT_1153839 [Mycena crocata]|nr:hypothetical protein C8R43DRAFT_1153839 [Mycena crocata]